MSVETKVRWTLDPETLDIVGRYIDTEGGRYRFRIYEHEPEHYVIIGDLSSCDSGAKFHLGVFYGEDGPKDAMTSADEFLEAIRDIGLAKALVPYSLEGSESWETNGTERTVVG